MNRQGRSAADQRKLLAALTRSRQVKTRITSLTLDGDPVDDLTEQFVDGQVNWHAHRKVTRSVLLALANPGQVLPFDSDSPEPGALDFRRQLQVEYGVLGDDGSWMWTDVFTGPVAHMRRRAGLAFVRAFGKERNAMGASWAPMTLPARMRKTDAIREILSVRAGETFFDIPDLPAKLPRPISLGRETQPWRIARLIAAGMGMQLFYNGSGVCTLRDQPQTVGFTFTDDDHVMPPGPLVTYTGDLINAVYVFGGTPVGGKTQVSWPAVAPFDHPISPRSLAVNDVPQYRAKFIHDDTIRTVAEARVRAQRELADELIAHARIRFEASPCAFFLDPLDLVRVDSDVSVTFRFTRGSFPLATGPEIAMPMTVGYVKDVMVDRSARR